MISKSSFIRGLQCLKLLYLHKKRPFLRDSLSPETLAKFKRGHDVGSLAQMLFPGGITLASSNPKAYKQSISLVHEHMAGKTNIMYEVPFIHNDLMAIMDIVVYEHGRWHAYEVKSSLSISDTYLWDIAFQAYVIQLFGITNIDYYIVHINSEYQRNEEIRVQELFNIVQVNEEIEKRTGLLDPLIEKMRSTEKLNKSPEISIGPHCHYPYKCDFTGHCWKHVIEPSIFRLPDVPDELKFKLLSEGKSDLRSALPFIHDPKQKNRALSQLHEEIIIQKSPIQDFFNVSHKPPVIFKFLHYSPAVPQYKSTSPFQATPILLMIMWFEEDNVSETKFFTFHTEFDFLSKLKDAYEELHQLSETHNLICYGDSFVFKQFSEFLKRKITSKTPDFEILDFREIFTQGWYIAPEIDQNYSFESVIKHFTTEKDSELDYNLKQIRRLQDQILQYQFTDTPQSPISDACIIWGKYLIKLYDLLFEKYMTNTEGR